MQLLFAQAPLSVVKSIPIPYETVENKPTFPGGINEFVKFVGKNYRVPEVEDLSGVLKVSFVIEISGAIEEIKVINDLGHGTAEEAKRVIKLSPKWTPGEHDGKPARVTYILPISISN
ncbi:energy transducer TonB [Flavobacterium sp.]|uniref:energy transducer TonB n=1 Tax=Flavobacterium sp. TaxID=239 RepID=UPI002637088F|nr:energy transducer TonB [Flavobacterium sp.]